MNPYLFHLYAGLFIVTITGLFLWFAKRNPGYFEADEDEDEERAKRMEKMLEECQALLREIRPILQELKEWKRHQKND